MAPLVTHLVVGERAFARWQRFGDGDYGAFLLGCVLADVNHFSDVDRRTTHFVGGLDEEGADALNGGCANFMGQLGGLLIRPWRVLAAEEQAFVAGYLCHLAADEAWKLLSWNALYALGIRSLADLPVPRDVLMTAFGVLSSEMFLDVPAVVSALDDAAIPDVLAHIPHGALRRMWDVVQVPLMNGQTRASYFELLEREGKTGTEVEQVRRRHDVHWEGAVALIHGWGGVAPYIQAGVRRSLETMPRLWR